MMQKLSVLIITSLLIIGVVAVWRHTEKQASPTQEGAAENTKQEPETRGVSVRTNTWFSSLFFQFPSAPLFVFPGSYQLNEDGLVVSLSRVTPTENTFFGSFTPLCTVSGESKLRGIEVARYGDWDVSVNTVPVSGENSWQAHFMQGSPVVDLSSVQGDLHVQCPGAQVSRYQSGSLVVRYGEKDVLLLQAESPVETQSSGATRIRSSTGRYRIIQLPESSTIDMSSFLDLTWSRVIDTQLSVIHQEDGMETVRLSALTDTDDSLLMTLWPHHRLGTLAKDYSVLGTYETVYGTLELVSTKNIEITLPSTSLPESFTAVNDESHRNQIRQAVKEDAYRVSREALPAGVYFRGAWFGGLASLAQLADTYGMDSERKIILDELEKYFRESLEEFTYDKEKRMLVASNDEFGNTKGNDHHFHYGYYLRAAAVLLQFRPNLAPTLSPVMNQMAEDIGNTERTSARYPYLRHFSPYAGHSWADAEALFNDGNDEESTSEALNAWYGIFLWGQATKDTRLAGIGRDMYTYELTGVRAYWFGDGNPFPEKYHHSIVSLVWGGKRDYATWFSGEAMHIHGIEWLPITPASEYLASLPSFSEQNTEILHAHPDPVGHEWGDLYAAHLSYFHPEEAKNLLPRASKRHAMQSTALLYQTVYRNLEK